MQLSIKVNMKGNGFFEIFEDGHEIATCYIPSLLKTNIEMVNAYNQVHGYDLITELEVKIIKAEIRRCETKNDYENAQRELEQPLKKEKENVSTDTTNIR